MEALFAYALLLDQGYDADEEYEKYLHSVFEKDPHNDILLGLEYLTKDINKTVEFVKDSVKTEDMDFNVFGKAFVSALKSSFDKMDFKTFVAKSYPLWQSLPEDLWDEKPFVLLKLAAEPWSYGDDNEAKAIFRKMFDFYNN